MTQSVVGDLIEELGGSQVQFVYYPGYHCGRIWHHVNEYYWELDLMNHGEVYSFPIASGRVKTLREANEAMNAIMHLWVLRGKTILEDYAEKPLPEKQDLGFLAAIQGDADAGSDGGPLSVDDC